MLQKWQTLANHVSTSLRQPHALITRLMDEVLYVLVHNETDDTTFVTNNKFPLGLGVYCETTMSGNALNLVPDALIDANWKTNPSVDFSLISYIGMPTRWPDGDIFGTICGLGSTPILGGEQFKDDMALFRNVIETDLQLLFEREQNKRNQSILDKSLCEVHHRVKNHLNILCGLIQLERDREGITQEDFVAWQKKINNQILAVSDIHTMLAYKDEDPFDLRKYMKKIVANWMRTTQGKPISVMERLDHVRVPEDSMIYYGIILNELITNSFTHAFADQLEPKLTLELRDEGERFRLLYRDNGPGLPPEVDTASPSSLGMTLITELTASLGGTLTYGSTAGASFEFTFPAETTDSQ